MGPLLSIPDRQALGFTDNTVHHHATIAAQQWQNHAAAISRTRDTAPRPGTSKTGKPAMEVRIDSQQVGRLSPKMTADLLPACQHLLDHGKTPTVRALVKGNRLRMEVVLYPARAFELTNEWVERVTEPEPVTEVPVTVQPVAEAPAPSEPDETAPPVPAAAWFDDPWGQARLRWWDGKEWTAHTYD